MSVTVSSSTLESGSSPRITKWVSKDFINSILSELKLQRGIALPLIAMNLTWFVKIAITTAFLGRLGDLPLAAGTLGFTFANVTGFSVLNGLCCAMEPICGQAFGAKNFKLLHKTLFMSIFLLLLATLPISFLWLNVDTILIHFGQQKDISIAAKTYLFYLLPDLLITSFLCPLKSYLSSQTETLPTMLSSALALALHVPINIFLAKSKGLIGVSIAIWVTDFVAMISLAIYVWLKQSMSNNEEGGGWFDQTVQDWVRLLKLSGPCCLTTCLEWWCYEILILLTGRLPNAKQAVGTIAIVLNFDYLLYSVMLSLATCASARVSNELGRNSGLAARWSAGVSVVGSVVVGLMGAAAMVAGRGEWGRIFTRDEEVVRMVKKMLVLMAAIEVVNFPVAVCGGVVRGVGKPLMGLGASLGGFYGVALPLGMVLGFKVGVGLGGLLIGFLVGVFVCLVLLMVFVWRIDWGKEAQAAQLMAKDGEVVVVDNVKT
ncbi:protein DETOXIFICATION 56 [Cucumis melo var. makuwa]|uniref:Protein DETOXIFICATION n=1 Tax=Cucumis melo var. makuwa TaxID=1194695 RepID=A0A5A7TN93_CUCMM|nr:protein DETOXIFICATION 56 [Cucumis melo var. makuwa]